MPKRITWAVLTGDLIASRMARASAVTASLDEAARIAGLMTDDPHFTRARGDSWQVLVPPQVSLEAAIAIAAGLKARPGLLPTRIAVGIGPVATLGSTDLRDASGDAFVASGRLIDAMPKGRWLAFQALDGNRIVSRPLHEGMMALVDFQASNWTSAQAEAVALALQSRGATHSDLAEKLGVTRQAVQNRLKAAGFAAIEAAVTGFDTEDWDSLS